MSSNPRRSFAEPEEPDMQRTAKVRLVGLLFLWSMFGAPLREERDGLRPFSTVTKIIEVSWDENTVSCRVDVTRDGAADDTSPEELMPRIKRKKAAWGACRRLLAWGKDTMLGRGAMRRRQIWGGQQNAGKTVGVPLQTKRPSFSPSYSYSCGH
ncbi:hypothetical protein CC80DRAFT_546636 [Byssothecium circinans]|uniref:Uncharacterized protein n=1 Tax=Byssothecium circinans TaxID=147558 RepID=A0A6A5U1B0_9PLEO|nr:hypothetical protein CC80DRAFT_546636 [Byssothecium circinans]